jgi:hypothetical protein
MKERRLGSLGWGIGFLPNTFDILSAVIPGRHEVASPESILTIVVMDSGSAPSAHPGMTK